MAKRIYDVASEARNMDRFEFIALFVSRCTARKAGRELTGGLAVRKVRGGWVYSAHGIADLCAPTSAAKLVDIIRRTKLNHYVRDAEDFRIVAHEAI